MNDQIARWAGSELAQVRHRRAAERNDLRAAMTWDEIQNHLENLSYYTGQIHTLERLLQALTYPELQLP